MRYRWFHSSETNKKNRPLELPKSYFNFFKEFKLNCEEAVICSPYLDYLNEYEKNLAGKCSPFSKVIDLVLKEGKGINDNDRTQLLSIKKKSINTLSGEDYELLGRLQRENRDLFTNRAEVLFNESRLEYYINELDGFLLDALFSRLFYTNLVNKSHFEFWTEHLGEYKRRVKNRAFKKQVLDKYKQTDMLLRNAKLTAQLNTNQPTNADGEKLLAEIVNKHKGKVLYIDFWAPWCSPCRKEMSYAGDLKKKFDGKDVIFVYMCVDTKETAWKATISELGLDGDHYLLNEDQKDDFKIKFQFSGIPRYVLVDKKGKVVDPNAKRPSSFDNLNEDLIYEINALLAES